ncbi:MAG TPA: AsnC family transcriptional regulator, partial [Microbacterium sp.]|nr:AsnC family transcriptional regulator [Microbacterium sp.]
MVGIRTSGDSTRIAAEVSALPEVTYVVLTAGSFDVLAEVVCASDDELIDLLNKRVRAIDGVVATESFVYLRLVKQLYDWGTQ